MGFDGDTFNNMIDVTLRERMQRSLRELDPAEHPLDADAFGRYRIAYRTLFGSEPVHLDPWHIAIMTLVGIHDRLVEIARSHHRSSPAARGDYEEFFELERKLDEEENEWRVTLGLPRIESQTD
jgi:hypothetical protein